MKVFAPERVARVGSFAELGTGRILSYGIPLGGAWVDVDDYFRQVTSGGAINDVVHAKVVASTGVSYTCGDLTDETGAIYLCSARGKGNVYFFDNIAVFVEHEVDEWYYPDYKGKKPIQPRRRKYTARATHGCCAQIGVNTSNSCPTLSVNLWCHTPLGDNEATNKYAAVKYTLSISYTGSGLNRRIKCSASPELYPIMDMMVGYFESRFGKRGENYRGPIEEHRESVHAACVSAIAGNAYVVCDYAARTLKPSARYPGHLVTSLSTDKVEGLRNCFMLHEPEVLVDRIDPLALSGYKDATSYWRNYLTEHALMSALESFPRLSDNSISNALEVLGFIKTLVVDHRIEMPKSLNDLWLSYRYSYTTTKLDIEEAVKFVRRHSALGTLDRAISCYGTSSHSFENGTTVTCRCECNVIPQIVNTVNRLLRTLDRYGLSPNFYIVWDMIPYSFMVDWFVPVGDALAVEDVNSRFLSGEFYKIRDICYSLSYTREFQNARVKCYSRWRGSVPRSLNSFYWLEPPSGSSKTTVFRVLDAASIFIGR
jgi:hypothetical protein